MCQRNSIVFSRGIPKEIASNAVHTGNPKKVAKKVSYFFLARKIYKELPIKKNNWIVVQI